jgi:hypothetical protein
MFNNWCIAALICIYIVLEIVTKNLTAYEFVYDSIYDILALVARYLMGHIFFVKQLFSKNVWTIADRELNDQIILIVHESYLCRRPLIFHIFRIVVKL